MWETARPPTRSAPRSPARPSTDREIVRLFGIPESEIANTLRDAEDDGPDARPASRSPPACGAARSRSPPATSRRRRRLRGADRVHRASATATRCSRVDGSTVDEQVAGCSAGRTVAVAESCTGGLLAARLTDRAGSSAYFLGGVVAYSNEAKVELVGVDAGADRARRRGLDRGRRGARRRRRDALRRRLRDRDHRHRRARAAAPRRSRSGSCASRCSDRDGRADHPPHQASRQPRGHPRPLHHGRDAPAAPAAARRGDTASAPSAAA